MKKYLLDWWEKVVKSVIDEYVKSPTVGTLQATLPLDLKPAAFANVSSEWPGDFVVELPATMSIRWAKKPHTGTRFDFYLPKQPTLYIYVDNDMPPSVLYSYMLEVIEMRGLIQLPSPLNYEMMYVEGLISKSQALKDIYTNQVKSMGTLTGTFKNPFEEDPVPNDYGSSGFLLAKVCPGLRTPIDKCPQCGKVGITDLSVLIIHLNDHHKWPRTSAEKPRGWPRGKEYTGPNIADWVEEYALLNKIDMSLVTEEVQGE